ncbi:sugar O-acetyltransferase [Paenibacillus sp. JCM 10914]|uniref:sugar O-acetyltransferase n=1 Tax=Paenibacillus sp. JCM 10914 TaxID=1236974 RepID=UPI0003CC8202|nr:sugar O-acetyltransferase [Paenibacillus sp. JCM 10914]GAE07994.1 peptidase, U32 family small subunit [Paenibacillus sp. JCM 10914]
MREEERIFKGILFSPADPELREIKQKAHNLSSLYSRTLEDETEEREAILKDLLGQKGENCFIQGPVFFHYGIHTEIGHSFFGNYNLTVQDDAKVKIGNHVSFGPNVTIVTPVHPLVASERRFMMDQHGHPKSLCYAKPVTIGNDVWIAANVTICGGVTIGDRCVIGAGSVVTHDIEPDSLAAGVPCKVIRKITGADSMCFKPEIMADCQVIE